jgi:hypothetical protein
MDKHRHTAYSLTNSMQQQSFLRDADSFLVGQKKKLSIL